MTEETTAPKAPVVVTELSVLTLAISKLQKLTDAEARRVVNYLHEKFVFSQHEGLIDRVNEITNGSAGSLRSRLMPSRYPDQDALASDDGN